VSYHFGEHFWCPSRWQDQKFNFQVILYDFLDGQDPFRKIGGHARSLRPEVWNFEWDLVWPIHMAYKNTGSIQEKILILVHPIFHNNCWNAHKFGRAPLVHFPIVNWWHGDYHVNHMLGIWLQSNAVDIQTESYNTQTVPSSLHAVREYHLILALFQLWKRLYNHKCPSVCLFVCPQNPFQP